MTRNSIVPAALLAVVLAAGVLPVRPASAADKHTVSEKVGKPIQAAQELLKQKKYKEAIAKLKEADAVSGKSPYETFAVDETLGVAYAQSGDYPNAIKSFEESLTTGMLPDSEVPKRIETLAQMNYEIKNYPKVIEYANRYFKDGGTDDNLRVLLGQTYYLQGDYANASKTLRANAQAIEKGGNPPAENLLLMLMSSDYKQNSDAAYQDDLEKLVTYYPKHDYWVDLLTKVQKKPGFAGRLTLDADRLLVDTGGLDAAAAYIEMAQLAIEAGLPGEAKSIMDKGNAAGLLGKTGDVAREKRLSDMANRQSIEDQKGLDKAAADAQNAETGLPLVKVGEAYASYGQYDKAIAAIQQGIKKGGLKYPEDAKLHLGIIYIKANQPAKAKEILKSVGGNDGTQDLARLWLIQKKLT